MKRTVSALAILALLGQTLAQGTAPQIPVTPQLRAQVNQYALQVAKRPCGPNMETNTMANDLATAPFSMAFQLVTGKLSDKVKSIDPTSVITTNINIPKKSGYFLAISKKGDDSVLAIISQQVVNGRPLMVIYRCALQ